jgi:hypothetical protein
MPRTTLLYDVRYLTDDHKQGEARPPARCIPSRRGRVPPMQTITIMDRNSIPVMDNARNSAASASWGRTPLESNSWPKQLYQLILSVARSCYWDLLYLNANDSDVINLPVGISRAIMKATISYREASKHHRPQNLYVRASNFHPGTVHTFLTLGPVVFVMA